MTNESIKRTVTLFKPWNNRLKFHRWNEEHLDYLALKNSRRNEIKQEMEEYLKQRQIYEITEFFSQKNSKELKYKLAIFGKIDEANIAMRKKERKRNFRLNKMTDKKTKLSTQNTAIFLQMLDLESE